MAVVELVVSPMDRLQSVSVTTTPMPANSSASYVPRTAPSRLLTSPITSAGTSAVCSGPGKRRSLTSCEYR